MAEPLTDPQEATLQALNDKWGVATWTVTDGVMTVTLDDDETGTVEPDGANTWGV